MRIFVLPFHEKAFDVNRSFLVLGFDCVPSFHSGVLSRRARVQSQVERSEPEANLDGLLARLHSFPAKRRQVALGGSGVKTKSVVRLRLEEQHFDRETEHGGNEYSANPNGF